jgi:3-hydroxyacyl-CoA dehydrogenase/enoyl-CoA hydratase/3-hydroxybutyryl-CoA epimerase
VLDHLEREVALGKLKGVIITSAKKRFLEGGELEYLYQAHQDLANEIYESTEQLKTIYRRLETLGVPVVAAVNGSATGAGYELTLACHHRVGLNDTKALIGLPEVKLGFITGGGGISRLTWMLGVERALPLLVEGRLLRPTEALRVGMLDELVETEKELIAHARNWICETPNAQQPWDERHGAYTSASVKDRQTGKWIAKSSAHLMKMYKRNHPAVTAIFDIMVNSISLDFDTVNRIESRYFTQIAIHQTAKNMTKVFWYDLNAIKKGIARPKGFGRFRPRQIGVIGAGQMGSAVAAIAALVGLEVILKDVSMPIADRGKKRAKEILATKIENRYITPPEAERALKLITPTNQVSDFEQCDLVLEAVFENISVKNKVIKEASNYMDEYSMLASNTSSLSISKLAKASAMPENFIGLKFFHPAESSRIVEIIKGVNTSDETVAKAIDFLRQIRRIPIVIQDRRGFFSTRVMEAYGLEGIALLKDGCLPSIIEQIALKSGMQLGPLAMMDEISIANTLSFEEKKMKYFPKYWYQNEVNVMRKMVHEFDRPGKWSKKGFYEYFDNETLLWEELVEHFHEKTKAFSEEEIYERLMFVQVLEALRCLESGVINHVEEVNIGSIYGWGFARHKGGVLQFINDYGINDFLKRTKALCKKYGERFKPPQILVDKAKKKETF